MTKAQFRALVPGDMIVFIKLSHNHWCPVGTEFEVTDTWVYEVSPTGKVEDSYSIFLTPFNTFNAYTPRNLVGPIKPGMKCSINVTWAQYIELVPEPLTRLELIE